MAESGGIGELREAAAQALLEMLRQGKVGAGDLIKVLNMMEERGEGERPSPDFVICVREEE